MRHHRRLLVSLGCSSLLVASCSESTAPVLAPTGSYVATEFRLTPAGGPNADLLAGGAQLNISIDAERLTTGRLFVPAALADGTEIDAQLDGRALMNARGAVRFDFDESDLFLEELRFREEGAVLRVDTTLTEGSRIQLRLQRP